jgi:hypothetical protein
MTDVVLVLNEALIAARSGDFELAEAAARFVLPDLEKMRLQQISERRKKLASLGWETHP